MTREVCRECVLKHIAQAIVLVDEAINGYPEHRYLAIGHLAEAESECIAGYPELANEIRLVRKVIYALTEATKYNHLFALNALITKALKMKEDEGYGACP